MLKLLKSKEVRLLQDLNILFISVTLLVSQPLKPNEVRPLQPLNILTILVTLLVLLPLKDASVISQGTIPLYLSLFSS